MFFNIVLIILIILITMVKPTAASKVSKKQRTSIADITHESLERLKPNMDRHTYTIRVRDADFFNRERGLEASFEMVIQEVVDTILRDLEYDSSNMRASVNFSFNDGAPLDQQYFININWRDVAASNTVDEMMRRLEGSFQSADKAAFSKFKVIVKIFRIAKGNGVTKTSKNGKNTHELTPTNISFDHPHIHKFHLKEGSIGCAYRAVVLYRKTVRQGIKTDNIWYNNFVTDAKDLAIACGLKYEDPFVATNFDKIEKIEKCRIIVFASEGNGLNVVYAPSNENRNDPLYILGYENEHYFAISEDKLKLCFSNTKEKGRYRNGIFCTYCYTFNTNNVSHKLDCSHYGCRQCLNEKCKGSVGHDGEIFIECNECNREFYDIDCYNMHKDNKGKDNTCKKIKNCTLCFTQIKMDRKERFKHDCTKAFCKTCSTEYEPKEDEYHICYMKRKKEKKKKNSEGPAVFTCYYDIETYQQNKGVNNRGLKIIEMIPYLLVCQMICDLCTDKEGENTCEYCGPRTRTFKMDVDESPVDAFIEFLMCFSNKHKKSKVIVAAHNGGKFDHQFIYASLLTHPNTRAISNDPIKRGNKIISMGSNGNIVYRDTLLFTPCALKTMPKCIGITEPEVSKGFFPYSFLCEDTLNYKGKIPDRKYFETSKLFGNEKNDFNDFYNKFENKEYNIFEECEKYCVTDVNILRKCFEKFRTSFIKAFDIDCLAECTTIASLCYGIYKNVFMPQKKITIMGRENSKLFTYEAIKWISYQEKVNNISIRHARNGGEKSFKIKNAWLYPDGFGYVNRVKTVFLYHGCAWHGHRNCYNGKGVFGEVSAEDRYFNTMKQEKTYKDNGFNVVRIWECEWKEQKKNIIQDPDDARKNITVGEYANRISNDTVNNRLVIDDSLFGGRTEPFVHYYPPTEGKKIMYLDYTSLYPYVQKRMKYPCGPPEKLVGDKVPDIESFEKDLNKKYFGLAFIKILPPQDLYIPVLAERVEKKLMFPLCSTCTKEKCEKCNHNENERCINGVFTTPEIQLALEMGYKIDKIYEIWSFKGKEYLFEKYVNYFLKIKTEASGPPAGVREDDPNFMEKLKEFVRLFKEKEGVELDINNIKKNPGMRFIAKLCLNSLWGKFAQICPSKETKICNSDKEVWELINQCDIEVSEVIPIGPKYVVTIVKNELGEHTSKVTNIPIASFTTSYARIKLYELINKVKDRALYCDTDSCIFVLDENEKGPETGNFLGELTDELDDYGDKAYADSFVCTGPKSYGLRIRKSDGDIKHIVKAKGLTINEETKDIVNFKNLLQLTLERCSEKDSGHDESLYNDIKDTDVTVKVINEIQLENITEDTVNDELPHKSRSGTYSSSIHNVNNRERTHHVVPNTIFKPGKLGGVNLSTGSKKMQFTANKRIFIKNSCRTVPYGFKGALLPL